MCTLVLSLKNGSQKLTTTLLITVVSTVIVAIANRPQWYTAVVGLAVKLSVVVTSICWSHCRHTKKNTMVLKLERQRMPNSFKHKKLHTGQVYLLHSSNGSSELSPQSSSTSHFQLWGMQRPLRHLNCPGRQVLVEQWAESSSDWSPQSSSPSHCHDSGIHRLFAHCHWWVSHWCVAEGQTSEMSYLEPFIF